MKIASIVGARPQFIKCASVSKELRKDHHEVLIHTGQHYDYEMSKRFFEQLGISKPDYNLGVGSASHGIQTGKMLIEIERVLLKEKPDFALVYGDTNSTLAGALAAVKLDIPVGHVEAGLRSFDRTMPEEVNRILTDHSSDLLFSPTNTAVNNLRREGLTSGVYLTGDVMYDVLRYSTKIAKKSGVLEEFGIRPNEYFLTTIHRPSNTDDAKNLSNILEALSESGENVVFPIHPRTLNFIKKLGLERKIGKNVFITKPVGYFDFIWLELNAKKILTDSGGIQKEAYILKVPCITLRENTEWIETVEDEWNILAGSNKEKIRDAMKNFMPKGKRRNVFGAGNANKKIKEIIDEPIGNKISII
jgi:UDP-N-acetylglucosamine 2-epimerase (non-hydrolysing)